MTGSRWSPTYVKPSRPGRLQPVYYQPQLDIQIPAVLLRAEGTGTLV